MRWSEYASTPGARRDPGSFLLGSRRKTAHRCAASAALAASLLWAGAAAADPSKISVELNKLETNEKGCRAYLVVNNASTTAYKTLKLDLVMFRADGIIGKRFAVDLAPLKAEKRIVKLFDLQDTPCDQVGSLLINDVMECATETGPAENCLAGMSLSSLSPVKLSK